MSLAALALVLASETAIAVRVRDHQGLEGDEAGAIAIELTRLVAARSRLEARLDDPRQPCEGAQCNYEIRLRTGATEVILLDAFAAGSRVRLVTERFAPDDTLTRRVQVDLPRGEGGWRGSIPALAELLFPGSEVAANVEPAPISAPAPTSSIRPYVAYGLLGAAAAALGAGIGLRVSSEAARERAESLTAGAEFDDARSSARAQLTTSSIVWIAAAALAGAGVTLLIAD